MTGRTRSSARHSRIGAVLAAGAVGALVLAGATACASTAKTVSVSAGGSSSGAAPTSASPSPSASGSAASPSASAPGGASATPSNHTMIPAGPVVTPKAQLSAVPSGQKLTAFETAGHSADGKTLYLGLESQGGACGQYDVVLQQSGSTVSVGLVHLPSGGVMCPMYVAHTLVVAQLSAPLDGRRVVDLADGQTVASAPIG